MAQEGCCGEQEGVVSLFSLGADVRELKKVYIEVFGLVGSCRMYSASSAHIYLLNCDLQFLRSS